MSKKKAKRQPVRHRWLLIAGIVGLTGIIAGILTLVVPISDSIGDSSPVQAQSTESDTAYFTDLDLLPDSEGFVVTGWDSSGVNLLEQHNLLIDDNLSGQIVSYDVDQIRMPNDVHVSPDGRYIAQSSYSGNRVTLYRNGLATPLETYNGERVMAFSPDSMLLALAGDTGGIHLLSLETQDFVSTIELENAVGKLAFSPDNNLLAAGVLTNEGTAVLVWELNDIESAPSEYPIENFVYDMAFTPDSEELVLALDGGVKMLDLAENSLRLWALVRFGRVYSVAISPDGTWLAAGGNHDDIEITEGVIAVWRLRQEESDPLPVEDDYYDIRFMTAHDERASSIAFSADSTRLFSVGNDGTVRLWDVEAGEEVAVLQRLKRFRLS